MGAPPIKLPRQVHTAHSERRVDLIRNLRLMNDMSFDIRL